MYTYLYVTVNYTVDVRSVYENGNFSCVTFVCTTECSTCVDGSVFYYNIDIYVNYVIHDKPYCSI